MSNLLKALRSCYSALAAAHETLERVHQGKQRLNKPEWDVIEPINAAALKEGAEALDEMDKIRFEAEEPLEIKRWISKGEFDTDDIGNVGHIYEQAGNLLDHHCSGEILGTVLFEGVNGKYYTISVEGVLGEANPEWVKEMLENPPEDEEDDEDDEDEDDDEE